MSFLKKLTKEFEDLKTSFSDDSKDKNEGQPQEHGSHRGYQPGPQYGNYGSGTGNYSQPPQVQSQFPGHGPGYGANYAQPPPPAPFASPAMAAPSVPPGWLVQWDQNSQRWFYVDQSSGRSQWEHPGAPMGPSSDARGHGGSGHGHGHGAPYGGYGGHGGHGDPYGGHGEHEKKKGSSRGMLLGAAGGLAVGAVGGALVANALNDSDDEHHHQAAAGAYHGAPPPVAEPQDGYTDPGMPPPVLPPTDADGNSVSSSDREDVQEAREEYEEALAEAHDSDASSSEQEALEEAREEYEEEYEETYGDDD